MERTEIHIDDYRKALATATDAGYRKHLLEDFVIHGDKVFPKIDVIRSARQDNHWIMKTRLTEGN